MKNQHLDKLKTLMGKYKYLFYLAILLSVVSSVISLGAYLNVYYVIESMLSAKGNLNKSVIEKMTYFGWQSVIYVSVAFMFYGLALLLSHIVAFNTVAKYRITLIDYMNELPLGYFQKRQSGKLRKLIEKNTEEVEHYIAHQLPDM
nr:ABC transporter ATP-binding protein [Staphylococcus lugdunensis]